MHTPHDHKPGEHHHHPHDPHHHPHTPGDEGSSRMWLYSGLALLIIALVFVGMRVMRARSQTKSLVADLVQMQFDPGNDSIGVAAGPKDAKVVVREFADFQCPACGGFERVLEQMRKDYVDTGKVRFVFFDMPLEQHKNASAAAQVARCAGNQDHYWLMHDLLYAKQQEWADKTSTTDIFVSYAASLGLDTGKILSCMVTGSARPAVVRSSGFGEAYGIRATPTVAVNGQVHEGGLSYPELKSLIDQELAGGQH
jgi:protein-disulfide isomerase